MSTDMPRKDIKAFVRVKLEHGELDIPVYDDPAQESDEEVAIVTEKEVDA